MTRFIPGRTELAILISLAIVCAACFRLTGSQDTTMLALSAPLALVAGLLGARKGGWLSSRPMALEPAAEPAAAPVSAIEA